MEKREREHCHFNFIYGVTVIVMELLYVCILFRLGWWLHQVPYLK